MDRLITCQRVLTGRTRATSSIQREVIQAQGQTGSNQKSATSRPGPDADVRCADSPAVVVGITVPHFCRVRPRPLITRQGEDMRRLLYVLQVRVVKIHAALQGVLHRITAYNVQNITSPNVSTTGGGGSARRACPAARSACTRAAGPRGSATPPGT